jgi:hypothetical protein
MVGKRNLPARTLAISALLLLILAQTAQAGDWYARGYDTTDTGVSDEVVRGLVYAHHYAIVNQLGWFHGE